MRISSDKAHNAVFDVKVLAMLITKIGISEELILPQAKSVQCMNETGLWKSHIAGIVKTLEFRWPEVSTGMIKKMAESGVTFSRLTKVYADNGAKSGEMVFGEDVNGKPRITRQKKISANVRRNLSAMAQ